MGRSDRRGTLSTGPSCLGGRFILVGLSKILSGSCRINKSVKGNNLRSYVRSVSRAFRNLMRSTCGGSVFLLIMSVYKSFLLCDTMCFFKASKSKTS
jgi:hypothetical protein